MATIKKIILLALIALVMVGCDQQKFADGITKNDFGVCIYDSCEYLIGAHGYKGYFAHKGNCRFCKERRQKELEELIIKLKEK
jgi:hypothetical protein